MKSWAACSSSADRDAAVENGNSRPDGLSELGLATCDMATR